MNRRQFLHAGFTAPLLAHTQAPQPATNFIFILADDLGWADLGCYGADLHETPNLDRLAREGVRFTQACAAAPVCTPTRASILTGQHPARLHMTVWREAAKQPPRNRRLLPPLTVEDLPQSTLTLPEALRDRGYQTWHVGKWHLGGAANYPEAHGFDVNVGGSLWGAPQTFFWPYRGTRHYGGEFRYVPGLQGGQPGEYLTDRLTDEALRLLERGRQRPFFLNLWYHTVHTPIEGKPELAAKYRGRVREGMRHRNADYAAMVQSLDENVGRLLAGLSALGLEKNTAVVFTSDNGGYDQPFGGQQVTSNAPLRSGKGSLYEGGIRVPLIVRGPGVRRGAVCEEMVNSMDFYPTLLQWAGLKAGAEIEGASLAALLSGSEARLARDEMYFHYPHYYPTTTPVSAIRTREWKLLEYLEDGRLELFDLVRDPGEVRNVAGEQVARAEELKRRLTAWRVQTGAQMPAVNKEFQR